MRNDARPIGEHAPASPHGADDRPEADERESVKHDRQSHVVNKQAEDDQTESEPHE
jgi:hypothetical protein